ncbi:MAG: DUF4333 domain-containing protein [Pseudanabaenaceae cyanobacterium SKYGB_i_bin29]|nr:DUF4333 domain-containing protein [Pseudanabaenaceae cyanobacterium SKYG29]MDW8420409.1 DUF4333 domain-containing protein [Pseudanabaenaceae cyanobacterium SKYGB_i_bin29]
MSRRFTALTAALILCGCTAKQTPLAPDQTVYAGRWTAADGTYIHIYLDGVADIKTSRQEIKGGSLQLQGQEITVVKGWRRQTYQITQPPQQLGSGWSMTLNGIQYNRGADKQAIIATLPPHRFQDPNTFAGKVERLLKQSFEEQTKIPVHGVTCPIAVAPRIGNEFSCRLTATDGSTLDVVVTSTDGAENVAWRAKEGLLSLSILERGIRDNLQQQTGQASQISCGGQLFKIASQGDKFLCQSLFADGQKKQIEVTVIDNEGTVRWAIYE